jgi:hypothetical protein
MYCERFRLSTRRESLVLSSAGTFDARLSLGEPVRVHTTMKLR